MNPEEVSSTIDLTKIVRMDDIERQTILFTLRQKEGDVVETARVLGLGPATVYRKIKRYGVRSKAFKVPTTEKVATVQS